MNLKMERKFTGVIKISDNIISRRATGYFKAISGEGYTMGYKNTPLARYNIYEFGITDGQSYFHTFKDKSVFKLFKKNGKNTYLL